MWLLLFFSLVYSSVPFCSTLGQLVSWYGCFFYPFQVNLLVFLKFLFHFDYFISFFRFSLIFCRFVYVRCCSSTKTNNFSSIFQCNHLKKTEIFSNFLKSAWNYIASHVLNYYREYFYQQQSTHIYLVVIVFHIPSVNGAKPRWLIWVGSIWLWLWRYSKHEQIVMKLS